MQASWQGAESEYSGLVATQPIIIVTWGQPQTCINRRAPPRLKRALFAKTSSWPDLARGLWLADLGWKESEQEAGRRIKAHPRGGAGGCEAGSTKVSPEAGIQGARGPGTGSSLAPFLSPEHREQ